MNCAILCEGETDQILISYYFTECLGFKYCHKLPPLAPQKLKPQSSAESVCYYKRGSDNLIIWAVGGHDDLLRSALVKILSQNKINSRKNEYYSHICILTDHDSEQETVNFWQNINRILNDFQVSASFQSATWVQTIQPIDFNDNISLSLLGLTVPTDEEGALETILLQALAGDTQNKYIVEKSKCLINDLLQHRDKFSIRYLAKRRDRIKAPLAVFLGVTVPERTFVETDKLLKSIPWKDYADIHKLFAPFSIFLSEGRN